MFQEHNYDLSRLKYKELEEQLEDLYVPLKVEKSNFVQRLLTVLRRIVAGCTVKPVMQAKDKAQRIISVKQHQTRTTIHSG